MLYSWLSFLPTRIIQAAQVAFSFYSTHGFSLPSSLRKNLPRTLWITPGILANAHPILFTFHQNKPLFTNFAAYSYVSLTPSPPSWVCKLLEGRGHGLPACLYPVSHTSSGKQCVCNKHVSV